MSLETSVRSHTTGQEPRRTELFQNNFLRQQLTNSIVNTTEFSNSDGEGIGLEGKSRTEFKMDLIYGPPFGSYLVDLTPELIETIQKTIETLSPFVTDVPLKPEYLRQPQFVFMFHIVTHVIDKYGLLRGLYGPDELESLRGPRSRHGRAKFFKKLVETLRLTTGEVLNCLSFRKLTIGHLPMISNQLLQVLALALRFKMNSDEAVKKVTNMCGPDTEPSQKRGISDSACDGIEGTASGFKRFRERSDSTSEEDEEDTTENEDEDEDTGRESESEAESVNEASALHCPENVPEAMEGVEELVCCFKTFL